MTFVTYADDLVDDPGVTPEERTRRFHDWRELVLATQNGYAHPGHLDWSVCRAFMHTTATRGISNQSVDAFLDALESDLTSSGFQTYEQLERYGDAVVGLPVAWLNHLFEGATPEAKRKARAVARAWALTDSLVDLREDLALGRLYLPWEDLQRFEVERSELEDAANLGRSSDNVRALILFEAARARALQEAGAGWALLVAPFARASVAVMQTGWQRRLTQIEASGGELRTLVENGSSLGPGFSGALTRPYEEGLDRPRARHAGAGRVIAPQTHAEVPRHIGIITDGNRRWAREHGVSIRSAHARGADVAWAIGVQLLEAGLNRGLDYVSVYGFSTENWNRTPEELNDLFDVYASSARSRVRFLDENNVRVRFVGRPHGLPAYVLNAIDMTEGYTAGNSGGTLAVCLNYGGQTEIVDAVTSMLASGIPPSDISTESVSDFLYAPDIPPLDLVIRTGGEQRLSNFMLWRAAYAE